MGNCCFNDAKKTEFQSSLINKQVSENNNRLLNQELQQYEKDDEKDSKYQDNLNFE